MCDPCNSDRRPRSRSKSYGNDDAHLLQCHPLTRSKSYGNLVHHQLTPLAAAAVYGAPIALSGNHPTDDSLPSYCSIVQAPLAFGGTAAAASAIQAAHRDRCLQARFQNPSLEVPSCQNHQCEFCALVSPSFRLPKPHDVRFPSFFSFSSAYLW